MFGKSIRLGRIFPKDRPGLFAVPIDHSVSLGPIRGLENPARLASELQRSGVDLIIAPKGAVGPLVPVLRPTTLLGVHVSASTSLSPRPDHKVLVGSAEEAVALGADLLSVQVNFGLPEEGEMLRSLGIAVDQCRSLGLPLLSMTYVKRPGGGTAEELRHACRAVADTGADLVKTSYPGSREELRRLVRSTRAPVLLGGGDPVESDRRLLARVREATEVGAAGVCFGRNVFQRRPVAPLARAIGRLLHAPA